MKSTRSSPRLFKFLLLVCSAIQTVQAQEIKSVSLAELRLRALEKSPDIAAADANFAGIISDGIEVGSLLNPEVDIVSAIPKGANNLDTEVGVELKQPIRFSDFGARERVQAIMNQFADSAKKQQLLAVSQDVTLVYFSLWALSETEKSYVASLKDVRAASTILTKGVQDGTALRSEKILFDGHLAKIQADLKGVEAEALLYRSSLTRLTALVLNDEVFKEPELIELPSQIMFLKLASENAIGKRKQGELLLSLRQAETQIASLDAAPQLKPKIGYQRSAEGDDFLGIGIEFPLPLWNSNSGAILKAKAQQRSALIEQEFNLGANFEQILKDTLKRCRLLEEQRSEYSSRIIPAFREVVSLELERMRSGQGSVLALWEAGRQLLDARTRWIELTREVLIARLTLEVFAGQPYAF